MRDVAGPIDEFAASLKKGGVAVDFLRPGTSESMEVSNWMESSFPFASWGRIDWDQVSEKVTLNWEDGKALLGAFDAVRRKHDAVRETGAEDTVYVISSNARDPIMALSWRDLLANVEAVLHADSALWIVCKDRNWCMEKTSVGAFGFGTTRRVE